jgi:hypothetical protein
VKNLEEIKRSLAVFKNELNKHYGVKNIGIFGSCVRGEQKPESDIDIYVEYEKTPSLLEIAGLENFLADNLHEKVDLVPEICIRPELRKNILSELVLV